MRDWLSLILGLHSYLRLLWNRISYLGGSLLVRDWLSLILGLLWIHSGPYLKNIKLIRGRCENTSESTRTRGGIWGRCGVREAVGLLTDGVDGKILIVGKILESLINFWVKILINKAINVLRWSGLDWSRRIRWVWVILLRGERSIWISLGLWRNGGLIEELLVIRLIILWIWSEILGISLWGRSEVLGIGLRYRCSRLIGGSISLLKILNGSLEGV